MWNKLGEISGTQNLYILGVHLRPSNTLLTFKSWILIDDIINYLVLDTVQFSIQQMTALIVNEKTVQP